MKKTIFMMLGCTLLAAGCQKPENGDENRKPDTPAPEIQLDDNSGNLTLTSWEGTDTIAYRIINPVEGGTVSAKSAEDWIDGFGYDIPDAITFSYQANEGESRSSIISITYTYGEGLSVEKQINVIQGEAIFEIAIEDIKPTSARMISSCSNADLYWTSDIMSKEKLESTVGGKENMPEYFANMLLNETWIQYGYESFDTFIKMYLFQGSYTDDWVYTGLPQATEHITFAVGMDFDANYTTDFFWGPEFSTDQVQMNEDLTFQIKVTPKSGTATLAVTPSESGVYYIATTIEKSIYEEGYSDEDIMSSICANYGEYIMYYAHDSAIENYTVSNMKPSTDYYAIAFGVDLEAYVFNSPMTKKEFTTTDNESSGHYASGDVKYYWHIDDLVAYNPEYEEYRNKRPLLAVFDFEFNSTTNSAYYIVWYGNMTTENYDDVYTNSINAGAKRIYKGDPSPILFMDYNEPSTMCVIAADDEGNYGDMSMTLINLTEEGKCTDYALFDEYLNALMGGEDAAPSLIPYDCSAEPQEHCYTPETFTAEMLRSAEKRHRNI